MSRFEMTSLNSSNGNNRINSSDINVEVDQHIATLSGSVNSYMQKKAAQMDALSIPGVSEVRNRLKIISDAAQKFTDEQISKNIKTVLSLNPAFNPDAMEIRVDKGIVFLGGSVDEYWKKMQAEEIVFDVPGVRDVVNALTVVPTKSPYDQAISADILASLQRISNIDIQKIDVTVEGGRVTIHGRVPDWYAYTAAHNAARHTRGVTDLTNKLVIA